MPFSHLLKVNNAGQIQFQGSIWHVYLQCKGDGVSGNTSHFLTWQDAKPYDHLYKAWDEHFLAIKDRKRIVMSSCHKISYPRNGFAAFLESQPIVSNYPASLSMPLLWTSKNSSRYYPLFFIRCHPSPNVLTVAILVTSGEFRRGNPFVATIAFHVQKTQFPTRQVSAATESLENDILKDF